MAQQMASKRIQKELQVKLRGTIWTSDAADDEFDMEASSLFSGKLSGMR